MTKRQVLSGVTLVVLVALLLVGAYVGWRSLSAPLPGSGDDGGDATTAPACEDGVARGDVVRSGDVTVSVYNAGDRSGLAGETMTQLQGRGFVGGEVGNAPEDLADVNFVRVLAPSRRDPAARLVALQFGRNTLVQKAKDDLGPGVEVIVGDKYAGLVDAPKKIRAQADSSGC